MINLVTLLLIRAVVVNGIHFNGGTIRWEPVDPYDNSSSIETNIIQSYSWTYPNIDCKTDVPVSTNGRSNLNANLVCITDCSTDGGYSVNPVNILTDCVTVSVSLNMMRSERSVSRTLDAGAHFYVSYMGSAWIALNDPAVDGLQWSITAFIDLRMREDGFINTPPIANIISPQYVLVNRTTQINIPVSDVNTGDDVRCRWSKYTSGVNRRKRSNEGEDVFDEFITHRYDSIDRNNAHLHVRERRGPKPPPPDPCAKCQKGCWEWCSCTCPICLGTTCTGSKCKKENGCPKTTTVSGATTPTTTVETPGTLISTASYGKRQAIDECGSICYPKSVPNGTTLSNCTLSFIGLIPNTWYAVAIQVNKDVIF